MVYRRVWRGSVFFSFLQPALFLVAMGLGVGSLMRPGTMFPGGVTFLTFLAPGLLASTCMQTAMFESSFPILGKMSWRRNYEAMCATPMGVGDIVTGELAWIGLRLLAVASAFTIVMGVAGVTRDWGALLAVVAAVLTGMAFAAVVMGYAATLKSSGNFNVLFRFIMTPLTLFSGVFFPVSRLPPWLQVVAPLTPLYHGVELARGLILHGLGPAQVIRHVLYLVAMLMAGVLVARRTFARRLEA